MMWSGFDPDLRRQWKVIREMVALQHQTPTREWPLVFMEEHDALLVVREWPNGSLTSYTMPGPSGRMQDEEPSQPGA
jgi:hypothetical protein